jgi:tetratricopeptide (TPR) repeat protein
VARGIIALFALSWALAQDPPKPAPPPPDPGQELEEEDASLKPKEYVFNPIQAAAEIKVGKFYMKRGSYRAAAGRFEEALLWHPGEVEACLLLGEARERLKDKKGARAVYEKCGAMSPDEKQAEELKRRLKRLG